jgi:anti-sigma factor RsiW
LSAYLDGELPAERMRQVEQHLATCRSCQREALELSSTYGLLDSWTTVSAPDNLMFRPPAKPVEPSRGGNLLAPLGRRPGWVATAACVAGLLGGLGLRTLVQYKRVQSAPVTSVSAQRQYVRAWNLDALADLPPDSIGGVYATLRNNER